MKRVTALVLFAVFATIIASTAQAADFWLEGQATRTNSKSGSSVLGSVDGDLNGTFGYYVFGLVSSDGYHEIYGGPKWKPTPWLEVGVGVGQETASTPNRRNAYFLIGNDKVSVYGTFENGGSGPWHKVTATYKATDTVGVGVIDQSFLGFGPRVEYNVTKNVTAWGAILRNRDTKETTSLLAINFSF